MTSQKPTMRCRGLGRSAWLLATLSLLLAVNARAQLVTGLAGASGSTVGPDGALYVTEGATGSLTRVDPVTGALSNVATGLPPSIIGIGGATDVVFLDGTAYVLVSLVGDPLFGGLYTDGIYRVDGPTDFTIIADLGSWSATHPPGPGFDYFVVNGVQYAIDVLAGDFIVTDGHHNRVLRVTLAGEISEFKVFGNVVPTGLEVRGHTVYMAEAGPIPHYPENGRVIAIDSKSGAVSEVASGAPLLVDVEFGRGQTLYALAQGVWNGANPGDPADPFTGSLVRIANDGSMTPLVTALDRPTSLEFIGNMAYVVTLTGNIWAIPDMSPPPFGKAEGR